MTIRNVTGLIGLAGCASVATAQYTTPNIINTSGPITNTLNGVQFVNRGLVGVGRIPAFLDAQGSTFGSVSSMAITPGSWSHNPATGEYSGQFQTLPDRGRNNPTTGSFVDYQTRVQKLDFTFKPLVSGNGSTQDQIKFTYKGLQLLSEASGAPTVGNDPTTASTAFGRPVPRNNGNISIDAEGLVALPDGRGYYVSDEYGSAIYKFDGSGTLTGVINPPEALMPRNAGGNLTYSSLVTPATGRRPNQGMEGLSISPDGRYLFAMNQSAAVQDSGGSNQIARRHTRVLVYDIQSDPTPTTPVGHYVMELPTFTQAGDGGALNRTAAQSEILALSDTQFLVLPRDGNGRGSTAGTGKVFTSVMLADLAGATNLVGTAFEGTTPVSPSGTLASGIVPVARKEVVNVLNRFDLDRFNLNLTINAAMPNGDANTLSEKWEGLSLVPDLATPDPTDYYLFVANDNDFLTTNGVMKTADGTVINYSDPFDVDTMFLVYHVNIAIPAPSTGALFGIGMLVAGRRRR